MHGNTKIKYAVLVKTLHGDLPRNQAFFIFHHLQRVQFVVMTCDAASEDNWPVRTNAKLFAWCLPMKSVA